MKNIDIDIILGILFILFLAFLVFLFTSCVYRGVKVDHVSRIEVKNHAPVVVMGSYWGDNGKIGYYLMYPNRSAGGGLYRWYDDFTVEWEH